MTYLKRDGVTRDGADANMFDVRSEAVDERAFAQRCEDYRHHFRFIVSPEDAAEMADLRARELMADAERDLGTRLDWIAVDHWNTDNPHIHVLVRGRSDDGQDLVISRDYISHGFRAQAEERLTIELGPRSEQEIRSALGREVEAKRWTNLDRALRNLADEGAGIADLRPSVQESDPELRRLMVGRVAKLERLGLAEQVECAADRRQIAGYQGRCGEHPRRSTIIRQEFWGVGRSVSSRATGLHVANGAASIGDCLSDAQRT
jgi:type IV secretory pathway VirD2 relaxase